MIHGRDPAINELIQYFDSYGIAPSEDGTEGGWVRLANHPNEIKVIEEQIRKCREDFSWFARNYVWITDKKSKVIPLHLNEGQHLVLDRMAYLKSLKRAQKLICLKARQVGISTLVEAMILWRTVLFSGVSAIIVSNTPSHASYLFGMMQFAYDKLPWWMRPMTLSRKIEDGLIFDNKDHDDRRVRPGLNSKISVQAANQHSGVGQGRTVTSCHLSELSDYGEKDAKDIVEGDLGHALADNVETFAVIESTARGTGNYFHRLWRKSIELEGMAEWMPVFIPWFFEKSRVISIPSVKWRPDIQEEEMRKRIYRDWTRCTNNLCGQYLEAMHNNKEREGSICISCETGTMERYILTNEQLHWMQVRRLNAQKDEDSLRTLKAEMTSTPEESFQLSGVKVFPQEALDFVNNCLAEPIIKGFFDKDGFVHGVSRKTEACPMAGCDVDHRYEQLYLSIWELPEKGGRYTIGADIAEGIDADSSVAFVNKIGGLREPDLHVATIKSNTISPVAFAAPIAALGHLYNEALVAIEINRYDTTFSYVRNNLNYPNLYRWKNVDLTNTLSHKWGWLTNQKTKPRLYQTASHWLRHRMWIVRSKDFYEEMTTFQKESAEDKGAKAEKGFTDDVVMAGMIALYIGHDSDWDDNMGSISLKRYTSTDPDTYMWRIICKKCNEERGVPSPDNSMYCLNCGSYHVKAEKNRQEPPGFQNLWEELEDGYELGSYKQVNASGEYGLM